MSASPSPALRSLRAPAYFILTLAALIPLADYATALWPFLPGKLAWRFGAVGLASSSVAVPLLMLLFIFAVALLMADRKVTVVIASVAAVAGVVLLAAIGVFVLDALQMKRNVSPAALGRFQTASWQAIAKLLVHGISSLILAVAAFRAARAAKLAVSRVQPKSNQLIVPMGDSSWTRPPVTSIESVS